MGLSKGHSKVYGDFASFSGKGYWGRHKAEHLLPNTDKSQVLLDEGWRFYLSIHALICAFKHQYHKDLHSSWSLTHSLHSSLSPSGSSAKIWCTPDFGWGHLPSGMLHSLSEMAFGVLQSAPLWFGVSQGTTVEGQKGVCTDLMSESRLKSALHWTTWAAFRCCPFAKSSCIPQLFFYECSSLSWPNTWVWPHHYSKILNV